MFACNWMGMGFWGGGFIWLALLGLAVVAVCLIPRRQPRGNAERDRLDSLEILKIRLARGEITLDEFDTLKAALK